MKECEFVFALILSGSLMINGFSKRLQVLEKVSHDGGNETKLEGKGPALRDMLRVYDDEP